MKPQLSAFALSLLLALPLGAAPAKPVAPAQVAHPIAMFLTDLSQDGRTRVVFKASAIGKYFFFEEPSGVTVYRFDGTGYSREAFLRGSTLAKAARKYRGLS
jgi:hypothetical protein